MSLYNILHVDAACRRCGIVVPRSLQFKYGECRLYDYRVGDEVGWGSALDHGERATGRAWVPAYSDPCPNCGDESAYADLAIVVDRSVLTGAVQAPVGFHFREDQDVVPLSEADEPEPTVTDP